MPRKTDERIFVSSGQFSISLTIICFPEKDLGKNKYCSDDHIIFGVDDISYQRNEPYFTNGIQILQHRWINIWTSMGIILKNNFLTLYFVQSMNFSPPFCHFIFWTTYETFSSTPPHNSLFFPWLYMERKLLSLSDPDKFKLPNSVRHQHLLYIVMAKQIVFFTTASAVKYVVIERFIYLVVSIAFVPFIKFIN